MSRGVWLAICPVNTATVLLVLLFASMDWQQAVAAACSNLAAGVPAGPAGVVTATTGTAGHPTRQTLPPAATFMTTHASRPCGLATVPKLDLSKLTPMHQVGGLGGWAAPGCAALSLSLSLVGCVICVLVFIVMTCQAACLSRFGAHALLFGVRCIVTCPAPASSTPVPLTATLFLLRRCPTYRQAQQHELPSLPYRWK
jgi:hypothetical protein